MIILIFLMHNQKKVYLCIYLSRIICWKNTS